MNPGRYSHVVSVWRRPKSPSSLRLHLQAYAPHLSSVRCLLEPVAARRRETLLGELSQSGMLMNFGTADVAADDLVVLVSGPGVVAGTQWVVESVLSDTMRQGRVSYQVAGLVATARALMDEVS